MPKAQPGLLAQNGGPPLGVLRLVASAASAGAGLLSLVTLVSWSTGLPLATDWAPHLVSMKPITALATLLIALAILPQLPLGPPWRIAFGAIAALLGAVSLIQEFGGLDFQLESSFGPVAAAPDPAPADFRMSPATGLAVLLAGAAAALLSLSRLTDAARFLAAGAGVIGATALLGHLLGADASSFLPFNSVPVPTVAALIAIAAAVLIHGQLSSP